MPEPLAQLLAAAERQPEEGPAQQRVVDIPSARFGVVVEDVEECHGGAGQPPEVDHAGPGGKGPVVEMHAVDVDQLESVGARGGAVPEDVAVVEVPVLDAFLVELHGKAGEGLQHGQGPRCGEACGGLRQRGVVGAPRDVVAVAEQSAAAVFAPCDGFGRIDAQRPEPHGVFVRAAGLAPAEEGVDDGPQQVRALEPFDDQPFSLRLEGFDRVASRVQDLAFPVEEFGQAFREVPQVFRGRIDVNVHCGVFSATKVRTRGVRR